MFYSPGIILGVISASGREINDQPGYQVPDDWISGMGFGELLEVMGVFELQHQRLLRAIKNPSEAGYEGGCIYKESF